MWCRMFNVYNIQSFQNIRHSVQIYLYGNLCLLKLKCTLKRYIHCHVGYRFNQLMIIKYRTYSYLTYLFWLQQTIETFWSVTMQCVYVHVQWNNSHDHLNFGLRAWQSEAWVLVLMICWELHLHRSVTSDNMLMHMTSLHKVVLDMFDNLTLNENCQEP